MNEAIKIVLLFDMDDTFTQTGNYFKDHLFALARRIEDFSMIKELEDLQERNVSTMNYPTKLKKIIDDKLVMPGDYMLHSVPTELGCHRAIKLLENFLQRFSDVVELGICTHRGFHIHGEVFTRTWIQERMPDTLVFEHMHCIDGKDHPNKIQYLKEQHPGKHIVLVDDNPLGHQREDDHDHHPEVLLYEKYNPLTGYGNMKKVQGMADVISHVEELIYQLKGWEA